MSDDESEFFSYQTKELEIDDEEEEDDEEDEEDDEELFGNKRKRTGAGRATAVPKKSKSAAAAAAAAGGEEADCRTVDHDQSAAEPTGHRVGTRRTRAGAVAASAEVTILSDDSDEDDGDAGGARAVVAEKLAAMRAQLAMNKQVAQEETVDEEDDDSNDDENSAMTRHVEGQKDSSADPDPSRKKVMLKLQAPGGHEVKMKIFIDEPFQSLFNQYCEKRGVDPATVHFMLVRSIQCMPYCVRTADACLSRMCRTERSLT